MAIACMNFGAFSYGLVDVEPEAEYLEVPDVTGSCAVHCSAPRVLFDAPQYLRFDGPLLFNRHTGRWVEVDSDVVCIKSLPTPPGMPYLQTAVPFAGKITQKRYVLAMSSRPQDFSFTAVETACQSWSCRFAICSHRDVHVCVFVRCAGIFYRPTHC